MNAAKSAMCRFCRASTWVSNLSDGSSDTGSSRSRWIWIAAISIGFASP